jgi:ferrous iron transport protein B
MLGMFATVAIVGGALAGVLSEIWATHVSPVMVSVVTTVIPFPAVASAVLWAVDGGLLAMVAVGIPYVLLFYVLLAALEDSGYLVSAAILVDRIFNSLGLPGRAAIPLMTAAGCNVPAIHGTRILRTRRERLVGSFLVTLTPCSARSAVVIAAVAPFAGPVAALAAFGVVLAIGIGATVAANALIPGRQPALVMELAPLRRPVPRLVGAKAWARFRSFVVTATPIMLIGSLVLGLVYEAGLWTPMANALDPWTMGALGLPAIAVIAIAFAFLRKELALQLLVALAVVQHGASAQALGTFLTPAQLFVFAVVTCVSIPCAATFATLVSELGRRAAIIQTVATLALALGAGVVLARVLGIA